MSYTKLFRSIVDSTIWAEDDKTRIVWITMLAMADQHGEISASVPGLARAAGVEVPDCEAALEKFLSPDKYSRTTDDEGRRIEVIDGGWSVLNHAKYRDRASKDDAKAKNAERQQRFRDRKKRNAPVTDSHAPVTQDRDIAEAEAEAERKPRPVSPISPPVASDETHEFLNLLWELSPRRSRLRTSKRKVLTAWKRIPAKDRPDAKTVLDAYGAWLKSEEWTKDNGQYVPGLHRWINDRQWENIPDPESGPEKQSDPSSLPIQYD